MEKAETIQSLRKSPLFNLSLASKELFHSNFLCWLGETSETKYIFQSIIENWIGESHNIDWETAKIRREFLNLDICITDGENGQILLVIENKVKSIPYLAQLNTYTEKIKNHNKDIAKKKKVKGEREAIHILLSLAKEFPDKKSIKEQSWKIVSYEELFAEINSAKDNIVNPYYAQLIDDYCNFICGLQRLSDSWSIDLDDNYLYEDNQEEEIRIHDLCRKSRCAQIALKLGNKLQDEKINCNFGTNIANIKKLIEEKSDNLYKTIFLNFGMTRGIGLIDVKILFNKRFLLGIQVQGNSYRRVLEYINPTAVNQGIDGTISQISFFRKDFTTKQDSVWESESPILEDEIYPLEPKTKPKKNKDPNLNSYGTTFFYQSRKIKENVKVEGLLSLIISDITFILKHRS